jgi:hypothetical protein
MALAPAWDVMANLTDFAVTVASDESLRKLMPLVAIVVPAGIPSPAIGEPVSK